MTITFESDEEAKIVMNRLYGAIRYPYGDSDSAKMECDFSANDLSEKILRLQKKIEQTMEDVHNVMFMTISAIDDIATLTARVSMLEEKSSPDQKKDQSSTN